MKRICLSFLLIVMPFFINGISAQTIVSPSGSLKLEFMLSGKGEPQYQLTYKLKPVVLWSKLGMELKDQASFLEGFSVEKADTSVFDQTWEPVWGEVKSIRNNYKELKVRLVQHAENNRLCVLTFRLFDDGLGFRYEFPLQSNFSACILKDERTEIKLTGNHKAFWIPGDYDSNEYSYTTSKLSEIDGNKGHSFNEIGMKSVIGANVVQTPLMLKSDNGLYINVHEAALVNYPAMNLSIDKPDFKFSSHLVPDALGNKAYLRTPFVTPWRTILVSDKATDILSSKTILNLNEPSELTETSWIKPRKYVGMWWEMHVGISSWSYSDSTNVRLDADWGKVKPNGRHGANTKRVKEYIDFASENNIDGVLVEGWNVGWEDWWGGWKEFVFDFVTPYPDFNVDEVTSYAKRKNIALIMHHETSASVSNYERYADTAYKFMKHYGYDAVKTGYVGRIIPRGEHHDGQWMVNHYLWVAEKTAKNKIMLNAHEPVRPTGIHRTYPNWLACEAARGNEFNAWSVGNMPEHETILPFTRLMGGPMDYTPGIFQIKLDYYKPGKPEQVHTTLAKQLALYVTMYSPIQMAADLPENYKRFPDAFQFIKDVAVDWDETRILEAEPGDFVTIARKAKGKEEWYVGAITDENKRISNFKLDFLKPKEKYVVTIYSDAKDANWKENPMAYQVNSYLAESTDVLSISLAEGGGAAVSIKKAGASDLKTLKRYRNSK